MAVEGYRLERIDDHRWRVPRTGPMVTHGLVFADDELIPHIENDKSLQQVANVACLPGIQGPSIAMPDIHWGYGFPIGGVAAFDLEEGVVSPGGVGYDINCGVRLLRTDITAQDLRPRLSRLMDRLYEGVPSGVGASRSDLKLAQKQVVRVLENGAGWAVENGYGWSQDLDRIEAGGRLEGANPDNVSARALERGRAQVGTLGSGNHFIEIGYVGEVYDQAAAAALGLWPGTVTAFIHSGSRGLGYQVCDDYLKTMLRASEAVPRRDALRCELRFLQPADDGASGARDFRSGFQTESRATRPAAGVRCCPQHRQDRDAQGEREREGSMCAQEGGHTGVSAGP